ncbi:hypothetical protein SDC9_212318 [bioreactor metagenome]|uniref:Uncharacterized protein n=1 Tax=bioreactor metagenome TaxID=1076179 RepID=A0A645K019_9ZZZZ
MALQLLHALCQQHAVLAARNAHPNGVALFDQVVFFDAAGKAVPDGVPIVLDDTAFDLLPAVHALPHLYWDLPPGPRAAC